MRHARLETNILVSHLTQEQIEAQAALREAQAALREREERERARQRAEERRALEVLLAGGAVGRALRVALLRSVRAVAAETGIRPRMFGEVAVSTACSAWEQIGRGSQLEVYRLAGSSSHVSASLILNRI